MSELILAIIGTVMFAIPLIMIITLCNRTCKELNDSFEKEKHLWEEYYELERKIRENEEK
jgi:hypothetical protein